MAAAATRDETEDPIERSESGDVSGIRWQTAARPSWIDSVASELHQIDGGTVVAPDRVDRGEKDESPAGANQLTRKSNRVKMRIQRRREQYMHGRWRRYVAVKKRMQ